MGYLLKEALKTLCGVNQWCYAVFWKIGFQNPKLLIWEECYHGPITYSGLPHISGIENAELSLNEWEACWASAEARTSRLGVQAEDRVHLLVNKMMMNNHVNVVGEGLVGRAAFTGNHQWILSENYTREAQPPKVLNEMCQQFSAGVQTVVVIPVLPHGVVQLGSSLSIMENMGFVNDVKTLVLQLGCIPGALLSDNYAIKEPAPKIGAPIFLGKSAKVTDSTPFIADSCSHQSNSSQPSSLVGRTSYSLISKVQDNLQSSGSTFQTTNISQSSVKSNDDHCIAKVIPVTKPKIRHRSQLENVVAGDEVIPSNPMVWLNQEASLYIPRSGYDQQPSGGPSAENNCFLMSQKRTVGGLSSGSCKDFMIAPSHKLSELYDDVGHLISVPNPHSLPAGMNSIQIELDDGKERVENDIFQALAIPSPKANDGYQSLRLINANYEDSCDQLPSGDDLFDILGVDFKSKLFNGLHNNFLNNGPDIKTKSLDKSNCGSIKLQDSGSDIYSVNEGNSDSGIFSMTGNDHLLDAVVSRVHSAPKDSSEDNVSCRTTLTKISTSSAPISSPSIGQATNGSNQMQGELFGFPKSLTEVGALGSCSIRSGSCKEDAGNNSQSNSIYGSQISSWVEQGRNSSVSTAFSKRPDEISKSNRKRLKPGEKPRARPKDRQMIQDRVKELREIVPNSTKCSIDALLERTIKHMQFLQCVTKHAEKLKQTGESKIISKDGGLLLKDNFEGGATWAYEVSSQSMVCPIIVEDMNSPRQMLVEMLCEERGLFLEIADIIRGLGLTILKGVMETRNDKIWARFTVEANRDVTRMEIFISLVRLLEQTVKSNATSANCTNNENMMVHQSFHQASTIPATW